MNSRTSKPSVPELRDRLDGLMLRDQRRLGRRLDDRRVDLARLDRQVAVAQERVARRWASVPALTYPEQLPVSQARDDIAAAIRDHQVVVLAGETGSGKTTQLPKILLGLGRGVTGMVGHTQPRRIAARAVAERVAEEVGATLGALAGYTVRFHDQTSDQTLVKVMTDGILLAELSRDRDLLAYDTIVLDEAHERSLTIDFLLGYLKALLPRRPDLKVVVTSATIDPERFSRHFDGAPILTVSGRTYPVEIRYQPPDPDDDQITAVTAACAELMREGPGDILVFLSGEREIRDTTDVLRGALDAEVVPLFGRLSAAEQHVVFAPHSRRRIVLATNVAETSLTVPGIRYVVDTGTARISRYSTRTKVQRLPIERISQASATQRSGRCGRVADGIAIRLYDAEGFASRPEFTDPEITRTNLASVLLAMASLDLGPIEEFPFVDPPDRRTITDGRRLLAELGALTETGRLTTVGRQIAALPVDPRMARMIVEAGQLGCAAEVLVIAAALSIQDPRERPLDKREQAAELHARFADPTSDLLAWLNLWRYVGEQQEALSSSAFRRLCKRELLSWLRIREWQDLHAQLRRVARQQGIDTAASGDPDTVTQALLAGLLSHVGLRTERREYLGARGIHFTIAPGTPLARKPPTLVVAAELVETSRLLARGVARVEPAWVERIGAHLLKRTYAEPHWSAKRGSVVAYERVTLYGVPIVARRAVAYGRIDPVVSRDLFLRHALVEGDWRTHHAFWNHNQQVLADAEELAVRQRRRDVGVDDETLYAFYDERVPDDVVSTAHFDRWWKRQRAQTPQLLDLSIDGLEVPAEQYPSVWTSGELTLPLHYAFEPGTERDGVTVDVPLSQLERLRSQDVAWPVLAQRHELVTGLIRSLPKALRVALVPAPDMARALLDDIGPDPGDLLPALSAAARRRAGVVVPVAAWDPAALPAHLRPTYRILDGDRVVGEGKDLAALQRQLRPAVAVAVSRVAGDLEVSGLTSWTVGELPAEVTVDGVVGYPTLVDAGDSVALRVPPVPSPAQHHAGVRRLLALGAPSPVRTVAGRLSNATKLALTRSPYESLSALLADCTLAAVDALTTAEVRTAEAFAAQLAAVRAGLPAAFETVLRDVERALVADQALAAAEPPPWAATDLVRQREALVHKGFVAEVGAARLPDLVRYLTAAGVRAAQRNADRDAAHMITVRAAEEAWAAAPPGPTRDAVRWMLEELRVSLFAPSVGAKGPVSLPRIFRVLDSA